MVGGPYFSLRPSSERPISSPLREEIALKGKVMIATGAAMTPRTPRAATSLTDALLSGGVAGSVVF